MLQPSSSLTFAARVAGSRPRRLPSRPCLLAPVGAFLLSPAGVLPKTFELETASIGDIQAAVDAGALTYEKLVDLYTARINAYDQKGPALNSVILVNPKAREEARALD